VAVAVSVVCSVTTHAMKVRVPLPSHGTLTNTFVYVGFCVDQSSVYSGFLLQKNTKTAREIFSRFDVVFCVSIVLLGYDTA
jgi:hypothetical protein